MHVCYIILPILLSRFVKPPSRSCRSRLESTRTPGKIPVISHLVSVSSPIIEHDIIDLSRIFFLKAVHGQPESYNVESSFDWIVKLLGVLENEKYDSILICITSSDDFRVCYYHTLLSQKIKNVALI